MKKRDLEALIEQQRPKVRAAFLEAIKSIQSQSQINKIAQALARGDVDAAVAAIGISSAAFRVLEAGVEEVFETGGIATINSLPRVRDPAGGRYIFRFDLRNPSAERELRRISGTLITNIVDDQLTGIRDVLADRMAQGKNPKTTALDIVGRVSAQTGKREGGLIGLDSNRRKYVSNAEAELAEGRFSDFLRRKSRDKRFDPSIRKAMRDGDPLTVEARTRIVSRYKDGLLLRRGKTIAREETLRALGASRKEAFNQAADTANLPPDAVEKEWEISGRNTRDSHEAMSGQTVKGVNTPFVSGDGSLLRFPHDTGLGAPAEDTINCECFVHFRLNYLAGLR